LHAEKSAPTRWALNNGQQCPGSYSSDPQTEVWERGKKMNEEIA